MDFWDNEGYFDKFILVFTNEFFTCECEVNTIHKDFPFVLINSSLSRYKVGLMILLYLILSSFWKFQYVLLEDEALIL